jgi:hypothetical protein
VMPLNEKVYDAHVRFMITSELKAPCTSKRRHMSASDLLREFITEGLDRGLVKIEGRHRAPELLAYEQGRKGSGLQKPR